MLYMSYVGCNNLCEDSYSLCVGCTGTMQDLAVFIGSIAATVLARQLSFGTLILLSGMHSLHVGCCSLHMGCYSLYMGCNSI